MARQYTQPLVTTMATTLVVGIMMVLIGGGVVVAEGSKCAGSDATFTLSSISPKYPRKAESFTLSFSNANTTVYMQSIYVLRLDGDFGSGCTQKSTDYVAAATTFNTSANTRTTNAAYAGQTNVPEFTVGNKTNLVLTVTAPVAGGYIICLGNNLISKPFFIRAGPFNKGDFGIALLSFGLPGLILTIIAILLWKLMGFEIRTIPFYFESWIPNKFAACWPAPKVFFIVCSVLVAVIFVAQPVMFLLLGIVTAAQIDVLVGLVIIVLGVVFTIVLNLILFNIGNGWRFNIVTVAGLGISMVAIGAVVLCMALLTYPFFFSVYTFLALFVNGLCLVLYFYYSAVDTDGLRVLLYHLQAVVPPGTVEAVGSMALPFRKLFLPTSGATSTQVARMSDILQTEEDSERAAQKRFRRIVLGAILTPIYLGVIAVYIVYVFVRFPVGTGVPPVAIVASASTAALDICFILLSGRLTFGGGGGGDVSMGPLRKVMCVFAYRFIIAGVGDRWWMMGQALLYILIAGYIAVRCVSMYLPPAVSDDGVILGATIVVAASDMPQATPIFTKISNVAGRWDVVWVGLTLCFIGEVIYASTLTCVEAEHVGINSTVVAPYLYGIGALLLAPIAALFFLALRLREKPVGPSFLWIIASVVAILWVVGANVYIVLVTKSVVITGAFLWGLPGLLVFTLFMARLRANNMKEIYVAGVSNVHNPNMQHFIRVTLKMIRTCEDEGTLFHSWTKYSLNDPAHPLSTLFSAYVQQSDRKLLDDAWKTAKECNSELYAFISQFIIEVNELCHVRLVGETQQVSASAEFSTIEGSGGGGGETSLELHLPGLLDKILFGRGCPSVKVSELENIMITMPDLLRDAAKAAWGMLDYNDETKVTADGESGMIIRSCAFTPKADVDGEAKRRLPSDRQYRITDLDSNAEQLLASAWAVTKSSSRDTIIEVENMRMRRLEKLLEPTEADTGAVKEDEDTPRPPSGTNTPNDAPISSPTHPSAMGDMDVDDFGGGGNSQHPNAPSGDNEGDQVAPSESIEFASPKVVDKNGGGAAASTPRIDEDATAKKSAAALAKLKQGAFATKDILGNYLRPRRGYLNDHPTIAKYHIIALFFMAELLFLVMGIFVGELSDPRYVGWAMAVGAIVVTHSFAGFVRYFHTFTASLWILMYVIVPELVLLAYGFAVYFNDIRDSDHVGGRILLFIAIGYPFAASLVMFVTVWRHYGWTALQGALDVIRTEAASTESNIRKKRMFIHIGVCLVISLIAGIGAAILSIFVFNSWIPFPLVLVFTFLALGVAITYGIVRSNAGIIPFPIIIVWLVVSLLIVAAAVVVGIVIGFWFAGVSVLVAFVILVLLVDATRREFATNFLLGGRYSVGGPLLFPFFSFSEDNKVIDVTLGRAEAVLGLALIFIWGLVTALSVAPPAIGLITSIVGAGLTVLYYLEKVRITSYSLYLSRHFINEDVVTKAFGAGASRVLRPELSILKQLMADDAVAPTSVDASLDMTPGGEKQSWEGQVLASIARAHPAVRQAACVLAEFGIRQKAGSTPHTFENIWEIDPAATNPLSKHNSNEAYKQLENALVESILDETGCAEEERAARTEELLVDLQGVSGLEEQIGIEFSKRWNTEQLSTEGASKYILLARRLFDHRQVEYRYIAFSLVMLDFYTSDAKRNSKRTIRDWLEFATGKEFTDDQLDDFILTQWSDNSRRVKYLESFISFLKYRETEAVVIQLHQTETFAISEFEKMKNQENSEWEGILFDLASARDDMVAAQKRYMAFGDSANLLLQTATTELRQIERESDDWWHAAHEVHSRNKALLTTMFRDLAQLSGEKESHDRTVVSTSEQEGRTAVYSQHKSIVKMFEEARSQQEMEAFRKRHAEEERVRLAQEAKEAARKKEAAALVLQHRVQRDAMENMELKLRGQLATEEATIFTAFFQKAKSEVEAILVMLAKKITPAPEPPRPASPPTPSGPSGKDVGTMSTGVIALEDFRVVASKRNVEGFYTDPTFKNLKIGGKSTARVFPRKQMSLMDESGSAPFSDVRQGSLGDCWLLAAISSVAALNNGAVIRETTMPYWKEINSGSLDKKVSNAFPVVLYVDGVKTTFIVDDLLPHSRADVFLYCQLHDTRRAWASMLEKASARRFNGFSCLDGGRSQEAFEMLMGAVGTMLSYKPDDPDVVSGKVWNTILSYYARGFPMACSSMSGSDATTNSMNIVQGHAFSLLHVVELEKDVRLLQVRNPWGSTEWKGAYSDKSNKWTSQIKSKMEALGFPLKDADDGAFWIEYRDFVSNFRGVAAGIMHSKTDFVEYRSPLLSWPTAKKLSTATISISPGSPVKLFIAITQEDRRSVVGETDFGVAINLFLMKGNARLFKADEVFQYERSLFIEQEVESLNNQKYDILAQHLSEPSEAAVTRFFIRMFVAHKDANRLTIHNSEGLVVVKE